MQSNSKEANIVQKDNKSMEVIEKKEVPTAKVKFRIIFTRKYIVQLYENTLWKTQSFEKGFNMRFCMENRFFECLKLWVDNLSG